ncbi:unnamed protein product [Ixodes hexagonus]
MASDSDSEEFFDAETIPPHRSEDNKSKEAEASPKSSPEKHDGWSSAASVPSSSDNSAAEKRTSQIEMERALEEAAQRAQETEKRQRQIEEMRRRMLYEDEEPGGGFSSEDQATHVPFSAPATCPSFLAHFVCWRRISSGRVGSLATKGRDNGSPAPGADGDGASLSSSNASSGLHPAEPDLVASTKSGLGESSQPVAPPRRRKQNNKGGLRVNTNDDSDCASLNSLPPLGLPSPLSAVESITQELEFSLDLSSAIQGQYVVKPQDDERDRGPRRSESKRSVRRHSGAGDGISRESPEKQPLFVPPSPHRTPEGSLRQLNMVMRTRSDSGRALTDKEILDQVEVLNLDTGEKVPLSVAEEKLPRCLNPLALHIMRITSEYVSHMDKNRESDEESLDFRQSSQDQSDSNTLKKRATRLTKMIGKKVGKKVGKTVSRIKTVADEKLHSRHSEEMECSDNETSPDAREALKVKTSSSHKAPADFDSIRVVQEIVGEHTGAVWTMKFSPCGRLMATAGQDNVLRIWVLRDAYEHFDDMRKKHKAEGELARVLAIKLHHPTEITRTCSCTGRHPYMFCTGRPAGSYGVTDIRADMKGPFLPKPFCMYRGHTADLLDVSWSRNYFILSSSMDKTVRLWHISSRECLCCFQHIDFVTAIAFHPKDDRYFLSGSLDGKLRLWNIPDKKVALWNELDGQTKLITAANFCQNGKFAVVGSYDGRCVFYSTEQLKYYTQIHVRSTRGKNAQGRKISGIEPMPGEDKILVTSNDSRIRLYDLRDLSLSCKYKGYVNLSSQIKGSFSHDGRYVISGSENQFIYIWKTYHDYKFSSARRDRNDYWEGIKGEFPLSWKWNGQTVKCSKG